MCDRFPFPVRLALANAVALVVSRIDAAPIIGLKTVRSALFTQIDDGFGDSLLRCRSIKKTSGRRLVLREPIRKK